MTAVASATALLHRRFRVTLNDQRVLEGDFQCLDKQGNLILGNSIEACLNPISGKREERPMGMVLISKDRQAKVEMQANLGEELSSLLVI